MYKFWPCTLVKNVEEMTVDCSKGFIWSSSKMLAVKIAFQGTKDLTESLMSPKNPSAFTNVSCACAFQSIPISITSDSWLQKRIEKCLPVSLFSFFSFPFSFSFRSFEIFLKCHIHTTEVVKLRIWKVLQSIIVTKN